MQISQWILMGRGDFLLLGLLILGLAFLLTVCFCSMYKGRFLRMRMQQNLYSYDETFLKKAIHQFWSEEFPGEPKPLEVYFAKNKIEIITPDVQKDLEEIEKNLGEFLFKNLGYKNDFFITFRN